MPSVRCLLVLVVACACWPAHADAQIYAWVDEHGQMVLSNHKIDAPAAVHEVVGAPEIRTTRPLDASATPSHFEPIVAEYSARQSIRPALVRAVIQVESGFNPLARSPKGAMGLMQLMPGTAQELGVSNPYDPEDNIRGGTRYLRLLLDKYNGDERLALAAYNAGPGAVDRYGREVPPYRETQDYVRKIQQKVSGSSSAVPNKKKLVIYKSVEIIDGRVVPRYSTAPPPSGTFERIER